jgi:HK97 gp10 family phage protein
MSKTDIYVEGLAQLQKILDTMPARIEKNILRSSLLQGANVLRDAARERAPSQGIAKNIHTRSEKTAAGKVSYLTGVYKTPDSYYAGFLEYGTASYYEGRGRTIGRPYEIKPKNKKALTIGDNLRAYSTSSGVRPQPFMRPTLDQNYNKAINTFRMTAIIRIQMEFGITPKRRITSSFVSERLL